MNAEPVLVRIAESISRHKLDAVLIGNAAAALQGAPVTTLDFDFFFRKTATNLRKLRAIADDLDATVLRPYYPTSELYRVMHDESGLQLDFMGKIDGIRSFEGIRSRSSVVRFGSGELRVAALDDIIRSKKAAGRPQDLAVLSILKKTRDASK